MKLGRVILNLDYVVDMDNDQMVKQAIECLYEDLMAGYKYNNIMDWVDVIEDKNATEDMIPEFLLEKESE
ncbi:hypothetical protein EBU71_12720 [bacterium]|nr:hypothetical protein [Candidatus Elulimicrobium humile]